MIQPYSSNIRFGDRQSALIFDHLHKCAGSTLRIAIHYGFDGLFSAYLLSSWRELYAELPRCRKDKFAVVGHAALGLHEYLPPGCEAYYITILREPIDRLISAYRFFRAWYATASSPEEFIRRSHANYLVYRLGYGDLERAKDRLLNFYHLFGLTERFDDFLLMLKARTGLDFRGCHAYNRTETTRQTSPELVAELRRQNELDIEFYQWACELFDRRMAEVPPDPTPPPAVSSTQEGPAEVVRAEPRIRELLDHREFARAAAELEKMIRPEDPPPTRFMLSLALAKVYQGAGDIPAASRWYEKCLEWDAELVYHYARMLETTQPGQAAAVLRRAMDSLRNIPSQMPDSHLNRFRAIVKPWAEHLARQHTRIALDQAAARYRSGHAEEAAAGLAPLLADPDSSGLSRGAMLYRFVQSVCGEALQRAQDSLRQFTAAHVRTTWGALPAAGIRAVAIFGAGQHTAWLARVTQDAPGPRVVAVLDDRPSTGTFWGLAPVAPDTWQPAGADAIVLSSDVIQDRLRQRCVQLYGRDLRTVDLYAGFPAGPYCKP